MGQIREDLKKLQLRNEEQEITVKDIIAGKPGLDIEQGLYRVDGGLIIDKVQYRAGTGRNIVATVGLKVTRLERTSEGVQEVDTLCVTKEEALDLVLEFGSVNSYVKITTQRKTGETKYVVQPFPARTEAFTQDERLVFAYKIDDEGSKVRPFELLINEDGCSPMMWQFLQADYNARVDRDSKRFRGVTRENQAQVQKLKEDIRARRAKVINPFRVT